MLLKSIPAGAALMAVLLTAACSSEQEVSTPVAEAPVVAVTETQLPETGVVETVTPPTVETATTPVFVPVATAPPQTGEVPSVMRRSPAEAVPAQQVTATFPPRVTVIQLREMVDEGSAVIVDVRDRVSFAIEHIPGSINIPAQESTMRAGELPKGKTIVTYCA